MPLRTYLLLAAVALLALPARAQDAAPPPPPPPDAAPADAPAPPPPAAVDTPAPSAPAAAAAPANADQQFDLRVKGLEENVNDLKEKIFRTKSRLMLLNEKVMGGDLLSGARLVLVHVNDMGGSYKLQSVTYSLDGAPIFSKVDVDGDLADNERLEIFNGRIPPGKHTVAVSAKLRGNGFGVFQYLNGYKFDVSSDVVFTVEGGSATSVSTVLFEKGGITTDIRDRPAVRFDQSREKDSPDNYREVAQP